MSCVPAGSGAFCKEIVMRMENRRAPFSSPKAFVDFGVEDGARFACELYSRFLPFVAITFLYQ